MTLPELPISQSLPELIAALQSNRCAVLQAPPGAGKTTVVPLAILDAGLCTGRILLLEPRRLAARAAAERMAHSLDQKMGNTVGYRIRGESQVSDSTRIEVITEGILTRMIQSDPTLPGVSAVIFDEFHERSLDADLGLALTWEARNALRDDLLVLVMSATLDADPVADMLNNPPVITSKGRVFPVETIWLPRPVQKTQRFEAAAADLVTIAAGQTSGGILVFLPGEGEIRRVETALKGRLPADCVVQPLFGSMEFRAQRTAISPIQSGRKIVLATSIAETSLTIQDIRVVVDCGRSRRSRFDPRSGMSRLVTERVTKAEAEQRRGRAGRVAAGICFRMWTKGEEGGLQAFPQAEIEAGDLTGLALELAFWGTGATDGMAFLTPPNRGAYANAQNLLMEIGALDNTGRITKHGRKLATLPMHPRLGHVLVRGGPDAALFAGLLAGRDPLRGASVDIMLRKKALQNPSNFEQQNTETLHRSGVDHIKSEAKRLRKIAPRTNSDFSWSELAAIAYPDRVGLRRPGNDARWVLSGGKGAKMVEADPMAGERLIVACDLDGDTSEARIRMAVEIGEADLRALYPDRIIWRKTCEWSKRDKRVIARHQECFGAIVLADRIWKDVPDEVAALAVLDGIRDLGLPMSNASKRFQARVELVRDGGNQFPDCSDEGLLMQLEDWLLPFLKNTKTESDISKLGILEPMRNRLNWEQLQSLDRIVPAHYITPVERTVPIDYSNKAPEIQVRLQEMFGVSQHPTVGPHNTPVRVTLLSPAKRPVQTTTDLPGFWATSYSDVRKDMRGRYPKHPWPEDPMSEVPTLRAKPRKR